MIKHNGTWRESAENVWLLSVNSAVYACIKKIGEVFYLWVLGSEDPSDYPTLIAAQNTVIKALHADYHYLKNLFEVSDETNPKPE